MSKKQPPTQPAQDSRLILTVSARTNDVRLGDSLAKYVLSGKEPIVTAMGAFAVNQMVKGLAIARGRLLQNDVSIQWYSSLHDGVGRKDGKHVTVVRTKIVVMNKENLEVV